MEGVGDGPVDDVWEPLVERFVDRHYSSLRGRVRTHVIHQHLRQHPGAIVDPSAAMLARATDRLGGADPEVAARVRLVRARGVVGRRRRSIDEGPSTSGGKR